MSSLSIGIAFAVVAGVLNGSFAAPVKYVNQWKWENLWSVWAVSGMLVFPWLIVFVTVPQFLGIYQSVGLRSLILPVSFGVGFGLAATFFGLGTAAIGIALNFAIAIGLSTALGSIVPLLLLHREQIYEAQGQMIFLGVVLMLLGIASCAFAGKMKEKHQPLVTTQPRESSSVQMSFEAGLLTCVLAGVGSPLINFGLAFRAPLLAAAEARGVPPSSQANVIWAPVLTASLVPSWYFALTTCEWKGAGSKALTTMSGGIFFLILGFLASRLG